MIPETITFNVPGMSCGHCVAAVKTEVAAVAGVETVDVDLETKEVRISGGDLDRTSLAAAIDAAGYDVAG
jgi:copper chaperone